MGFGAFVMASIQSNQRETAENVSQAIMEAYNNGEPGRIDGFFTEDFVCHLPGGATVDGPEAYKQRISAMREGFPDFRKEQEFLVVEGNEAAVHYRWSGTHEGEFMGIAPTGNHVETTSVGLLRFEDDRLAEMWAYSDGQTLMNQLGVED